MRTVELPRKGSQSLSMVAGHVGVFVEHEAVHVVERALIALMRRAARGRRPGGGQSEADRAAPERSARHAPPGAYAPSTSAASIAWYVRIASAPARRIDVSTSIIARS